MSYYIDTDGGIRTVVIARADSHGIVLVYWPSLPLQPLPGHYGIVIPWLLKVEPRPPGERYWWATAGWRWRRCRTLLVGGRRKQCWAMMPCRWHCWWQVTDSAVAKPEEHWPDDNHTRYCRPTGGYQAPVMTWWSDIDDGSDVMIVIIEMMIFRLFLADERDTDDDQSVTYWWWWWWWYCARRRTILLNSWAWYDAWLTGDSSDGKWYLQRHWPKSDVVTTLTKYDQWWQSLSDNAAVIDDDAGNVMMTSETLVNGRVTDRRRLPVSWWCAVLAITMILTCQQVFWWRTGKSVTNYEPVLWQTIVEGSTGDDDCGDWTMLFIYFGRATTLLLMTGDMVMNWWRR